jgi:hypothetical protein
MMIVIIDIRDPIMNEFVLEGQTVNQKYYLEVLTKLRERMRTESSELRKKKSLILHEDSASAHNALAMKQFLAAKCIPVLQHPLYSSDLAPYGYYLFPKLKIALKGTHFQSVDEV